MTKVEIITIGDELLIGQVIDTNSAWMSQLLNKNGLDVQYISTVGDNESDIIDAFDMAFSRVSIVLVTGGIGPTKDDITKKTLCRYFNTRLIFDEKTLETVETVIGRNGLTINELTKNQAYIPEDCTVIQNKAGTAPITWFEKEGKVLISMPGVPYEMKWAMSHEIVPRLMSFFQITDSIQHHSFWVKNYSESKLAIYLETFENELPATIKLAYLPNSGLIRLRLTGKYSEKAQLDTLILEQRNKLVALLGKNIISEGDDSLEIVLDNILKKNGLTLGLAESCTGGKLANLFTAIPGCSQYLKGGVVAYSNEAKANILGVNPSVIEKYGAVSTQVAEEMVLGAKQIFNADCAIATSGIAGPGGGTIDKPVGTVCIAVSLKEKLYSEQFHFTNNRESNVLRACTNGMRLLFELL
jgi:nicotinamide-nucleotide amidase